VTPSLLNLTHPGRPEDQRAAAEVIAEVESSEAWETFIADLTAHHPRYILDTSDAGVRGLERFPITRFPELQRIVDDEYRFVRTIDGIDIYERTAPIREPGAP
jgi:hypothetical protein